MGIKIITPEDQLNLSIRLKNDDDTALVEILQRIGPKAYSVFCRRFPTLKAYMEDALEIALERLWSYRHRYDPSKMSLQSWFFLLTRSVLQDVLRTSWYRAREREITFDIENLPNPNSVGLDQSPREERDITEALNMLSEIDQRIILAYAHANGEGCWAADLAEELPLSAGAIRTRRGRILEDLRVEMKRRGYTVSGIDS